MKPTILLPLILLSTPAVLAQQADNRSPEQMLKATIGGVMDAIRSDPAARAGDLARTYQLVQQRFLTLEASQGKASDQPICAMAWRTMRSCSSVGQLRKR